MRTRRQRHLPGPDPRVFDPVFQALPAEVQALKREGWAEDALQRERMARSERSEVRLRLAEGGAVFVGTRVFAAWGLGVRPADMRVGEFIEQVGVAALFGLVLGALWSRLDWSSFGAGISAGIASVLLEFTLMRMGIGHMAGLFVTPLLAGGGALLVSQRHDGPRGF